MEKDYTDILIQLTKKAFKAKEVPIAALIVRNNKIIAKNYNKREKSNNPLGHAEVLCVVQAAKKIKSWKLFDCDLYVTLKPCPMCEKIINECRINNVYYLVEKLEQKKPFGKTKYQILAGKNDEKSKEIKDTLNSFFVAKR